jgi:hypothetical protein
MFFQKPFTFSSALKIGGSTHAAIFPPPACAHRRAVGARRLRPEVGRARHPDKRAASHTLRSGRAIAIQSESNEGIIE